VLLVVEDFQRAATSIATPSRSQMSASRSRRATSRALAREQDVQGGVLVGLDRRRVITTPRSVPCGRTRSFIATLSVGAAVLAAAAS